ncbi:MAG: hypothetical protein M0R33_17230 [Methylomonas sp.]|jgi:hypothetical protein|uniref:hypothetical protein n=1 Tax=Methylomonas sp. TaxID=418 RepID=UPI002601412C|nr:hypothetical protein [Methylomonas sp.]MCK9608190.1 hypothetical protein [Methylomonas sp.]
MDNPPQQSAVPEMPQHKQEYYQTIIYNGESIFESFIAAAAESCQMVPRQLVDSALEYVTPIIIILDGCASQEDIKKYVGCKFDVIKILIPGEELSIIGVPDEDAPKEDSACIKFTPEKLVDHILLRHNYTISHIFDLLAMKYVRNYKPRYPETTGMNADYFIRGLGAIGIINYTEYFRTITSSLMYNEIADDIIKSGIILEQHIEDKAAIAANLFTTYKTITIREKTYKIGIANSCYYGEQILRAMLRQPMSSDEVIAPTIDILGKSSKGCHSFWRQIGGNADIAIVYFATAGSDECRFFVDGKNSGEARQSLDTSGGAEIHLSDLFDCGLLSKEYDGLILGKPPEQQANEAMRRLNRSEKHPPLSRELEQACFMAFTAPREVLKKLCEKIEIPFIL